LRLVHCTTGNAALRDDLIQEALVHLWLVKTRRPGQTKSWYLQSCKFHLRHYLSSGRSIDSAKRRAGQLSFNSDSAGGDEIMDLVDTGPSVFSCVSARDLIAQLSRNLLPEEKAVLDCLADGLGSREIGRKLNVSHTIVIKRRRKLACLLRELETISTPRMPALQTNGFPHLNGHPAMNGAKVLNSIKHYEIATTGSARVSGLFKRGLERNGSQPAALHT